MISAYELYTAYDSYDFKVAWVVQDFTEATGRTSDIAAPPWDLKLLARRLDLQHLQQPNVYNGILQCPTRNEGAVWLPQSLLVVSLTFDWVITISSQELWDGRLLNLSNLYLQIVRWALWCSMKFDVYCIQMYQEEHAAIQKGRQNSHSILAAMQHDVWNIVVFRCWTYQAWQLIHVDSRVLIHLLKILKNISVSVPTSKSSKPWPVFPESLHFEAAQPGGVGVWGSGSRRREFWAGKCEASRRLHGYSMLFI
jgi:hypothetical protein